MMKLRILSLTFALVFLSMPAFAKNALEDDSEELIQKKLKGPIAPGPEDELPVRPADLSNKTVGGEVKKILERTSDVKLRGEAQTGGIISSAEPMINSPLSRYKGDELKFFKVSIANNSNQPMLILGAQTSLDIDAATRATAPRKSIDSNTLEKHDNVILSNPKKIAVGIASAGSLGFLGPLTYEYLSPSEHRKRSLGIALGRDRGRHEVEGERFGLRLIMPGDNTSGWVAFNREALLTKSEKIYVPVMYPPYNRVSEVIGIPLNSKVKTKSKNAK